MGKRELVALLCLPSWCLVIVVWLLLAMPRVCLQFVIVVFPDNANLLFLMSLFSQCLFHPFLLSKWASLAAVPTAQQGRRRLFKSGQAEEAIDCPGPKRERARGGGFPPSR